MEKEKQTRLIRKRREENEKSMARYQQLLKEKARKAHEEKLRDIQLNKEYIQMLDDMENQRKAAVEKRMAASKAKEGKGMQYYKEVVLKKMQQEEDRRLKVLADHEAKVETLLREKQERMDRDT